MKKLGLASELHCAKAFASRSRNKIPVEPNNRLAAAYSGCCCAAAAYDRELEIVPVGKPLSPSLPATLNLTRQLCKAEGKVLRSYDAAFLLRLASK